MAQTKNTSGTVANEYFPPTSPIQRVLIAHFNLYELCHDGKSLGEDASLEEISEEILFYHRCSPFGANAGEDKDWNLASSLHHGRCSEEAVSFLGLCKALYALPESLKPSKSGSSSNIDSEEEDRTNSIYFGNSILVFVPLESSLDIVAIIQISRLYQNGTKSHTGSGNPLAISESIERTHRLFSILHGGGILHRLDETRPSCKTTTSTPRYPGLKKLFGLLKDIRKTKDTLFRNGSSNHPEESTQRIAELEAEVKSCREALPIRSLRRDLELHYNEYLSYFLEVCIRNGGAGRCLVELMPIPISQDSGSHVFQVPPSNIKDQRFESIKNSVLQILQTYPNEEDIDSSLLGIAVFESSQLLYSFSNSDRVDLSNATVTLLMAYMASYRTKMSYLAMSIDGETSSSLPEAQPSLLKRLLSPMIEKTPNQTSIPTPNNNSTRDGRGRFLPSPPPFMLGASDRMYNLSYDDNKQDIWAPRVHLPIPSGTEWKINDRLVSHMVVFEYLELSFLIFLNLPSLENPGLSELSETILLLMDLEERLSDAIIGASSELIATDVASEPGQDILIVEPAQEKMILLMDPKLQSPRGSKKKRTVHDSRDKSEMRRFMGFGPRKKDTLPQSQSTIYRSTRVEWSAFGLDCRHLFVSNLPLDICLAFDDMIKEVRNVTSGAASSLPEEDGTYDETSSAILELCTSMPHGWIYALATKEKEVYVFFDSSIYVTVADVHSAVEQIKERYIETN